MTVTKKKSALYIIIGLLLSVFMFSGAAVTGLAAEKPAQSGTIQTATIQDAKDIAGGFIDGVTTSLVKLVQDHNNLLSQYGNEEYLVQAIIPAAETAKERIYGDKAADDAAGLKEIFNEYWTGVWEGNIYFKLSGKLHFWDSRMEAVLNGWERVLAANSVLNFNAEWYNGDWFNPNPKTEGYPAKYDFSAKTAKLDGIGGAIKELKLRDVFEYLTGNKDFAFETAKVTLNYNDGTGPVILDVPKGACLNAPADPVDYNFAADWRNATDSKRYDFKLPVDEDTVIGANWIEVTPVTGISPETKIIIPNMQMTSKNGVAAITFLGEADFTLINQSKDILLNDSGDIDTVYAAVNFIHYNRTAGQDKTTWNYWTNINVKEPDCFQDNKDGWELLLPIAKRADAESDYEPIAGYNKTDRFYYWDADKNLAAVFTLRSTLEDYAEFISGFNDDSGLKKDELKALLEGIDGLDRTAGGVVSVGIWAELDAAVSAAGGYESETASAVVQGYIDNINRAVENANDAVKSAFFNEFMANGADFKTGGYYNKHTVISYFYNNGINSIYGGFPSETANAAEIINWYKDSTANLTKMYGDADIIVGYIQFFIDGLPDIFSDAAAQLDYDADTRLDFVLAGSVYAKGDEDLFKSFLDTQRRYNTEQGDVYSAANLFEGLLKGETLSKKQECLLKNLLHGYLKDYVDGVDISGKIAAKIPELKALAGDIIDVVEKLAGFYDNLYEFLISFDDDYISALVKDQNGFKNYGSVLDKFLEEKATVSSAPARMGARVATLDNILLRQNLESCLGGLMSNGDIINQTDALIIAAQNDIEDNIIEAAVSLFMTEFDEYVGQLVAELKDQFGENNIGEIFNGTATRTIDGLREAYEKQLRETVINGNAANIIDNILTAENPPVKEAVGEVKEESAELLNGWLEVRLTARAEDLVNSGNYSGETIEIIRTKLEKILSDIATAKADSGRTKQIFDNATEWFDNFGTDNQEKLLQSLRILVAGFESGYENAFDSLLAAAENKIKSLSVWSELLAVRDEYRDKILLAKAIIDGKREIANALEGAYSHDTREDAYLELSEISNYENEIEKFDTMAAVETYVSIAKRAVSEAAAIFKLEDDLSDIVSDLNRYLEKVFTGFDTEPDVEPVYDEAEFSDIISKYTLLINGAAGKTTAEGFLSLAKTEIAQRVIDIDTKNAKKDAYSRLLAADAEGKYAGIVIRYLSELNDAGLAEITAILQKGLGDLASAIALDKAKAGAVNGTAENPGINSTVQDFVGEGHSEKSFADIVEEYIGRINKAATETEIDEILAEAVKALISRAENIEANKNKIENSLTDKDILNLIRSVLGGDADNSGQFVSQGAVTAYFTIAERADFEAKILAELRKTGMSNAGIDAAMVAVRKYTDSLEKMDYTLSSDAFGQELESIESTLQIALAAIRLQEGESDADKAAHVSKLIEEIDSDSSDEYIKAVRAAYDALTPKQKNLVTNYADLLAAESYGNFEFLFWMTIALSAILFILAVIIFIILRKENRAGKSAGDTAKTINNPEDEKVIETEDNVSNNPADNEINDKDVETDESESGHDESKNENAEADKAEAVVKTEEPRLELLEVAADTTAAKNRRKPMRERLFETLTDNKVFYGKIKNELLSYRKVKCRMTKTVEKITTGKEVIVRIRLAGKSLRLYLALTPDLYDIKTYRHKNVGDKRKYKETPFMIKVKSERACVKALKLINDIVTGKELAKCRRFEETDYVMMYRNKALTPIGMQDLGHLIADEITADQTGILSGRAAEKCVVTENIPVNPNPVKYTVEIGIINDNFKSGETVGLKQLLKKKLVPAGTNYIKIGDSGSLNKVLTMVADNFAPSALKMILLLGGLPVRLNMTE